MLWPPAMLLAVGLHDEAEDRHIGSCDFLRFAHLFEDIIPAVTDRPYYVRAVADGTLVCLIMVAPWGFQFYSFSFLLFRAVSWYVSY